MPSSLLQQTESPSNRKVMSKPIDYAWFHPFPCCHIWSCHLYLPNTFHKSLSSFSTFQPPASNQASTISLPTVQELLFTLLPIQWTSGQWTVDDSLAFAFKLKMRGSEQKWQKENSRLVLRKMVTCQNNGVMCVLESGGIDWKEAWRNLLGWLKCSISWVRWWLLGCIQICM